MKKNKNYFTKHLIILVLLAPFSLIAQNEIEPNGGFIEASPIDINTVTTAFIGFSGDQDIFKFNITEPGMLRLNILEVPPNIDLNAIFYNVDQEEIYKYFDAEDGTAFDLWVSSCKVGDHFILLEDGWIGSSSGDDFNEDIPYKFQVEFIAFEDVDNCECENENFNSACQIELGTTYEALIAPNYRNINSVDYTVDNDYYKFEVDEPSQIHLEVTEVPGNIELEVFIYDAEQEEIWSDYTLQEGQPYEIWFSSCTAGTYYLFFRDGSSSLFGGADFNGEESYKFQVNAESLTFLDEFECNNAFNDATIIEYCETLSGSINPWFGFDDLSNIAIYDVDYYKVDLEANREVDILLEYVPNETAICLSIYDKWQERLENISGNLGQPLNISFLPEEDGTYYIEIEDCGNDFSADDKYTLKVGCNLISSIFDNLVQPEIKIYPNPSIGEILIRSDALDDSWGIKIFKSTGEQVYFSNFSRQIIDLKDLANGIYFVEFWNEKTSFQKRILISR